MRLVHHSTTPSAGGRPATPPPHVIAEAARRNALGHDRLPGAIDLAKQPGLLYRLYAILND